MQLLSSLVWLLACQVNKLILFLHFSFNESLHGYFVPAAGYIVKKKNCLVPAFMLSTEEKPLARGFSLMLSFSHKEIISFPT